MEASEADAIIRETKPWHARCAILGLHKRCDYLLPENSSRPIARHTVCLRCGLLLEVKFLPPVPS